MDKDNVSKFYKFDDRSTSDVIVRLRNNEGRPELFYSHSFVLKTKSKFFAEKLSNPNSVSSIEIHCSDFDYDYHVILLRYLYLSHDALLDACESVKSALGILQVASNLLCEEITLSCIQFLEAVPWEDNDEEAILKVVSKLGPIAMPVLARIQPVDLVAVKNVFLSAVRFATSIGGPGPCPPFGDELKNSVQEQVEYMLGEDEDAPLVTADDEVKAEVKMGLFNISLSFEKDLSVLYESDLVSETAENIIMQSLSDLEWICSILTKMDLMKDFVSKWAEMSSTILIIVEDKKFDFRMWGFKKKLIELTAKVLEAVGYGNVIIPTPSRVQFLRTWLPYIRKMKPCLDSVGDEETGFPYKMDEDLCQSIEGTIVSFILALPSNDQADILVDWMKSGHVKYPDLSEAFEIWCYRSKSAKRRLIKGSSDEVRSLDLSN